MGFVGSHVGKKAGGAVGGAIGRKVGGAIGRKAAGERGHHAGKAVGEKIGRAGGSAAGATAGEYLSFRKGGKVNKTGLALLHKGELVVPAKHTKEVGKDLKAKIKQNGGVNM